MVPPVMGPVPRGTFRQDRSAAVPISLTHGCPRVGGSGRRRNLTQRSLMRRIYFQLSPVSLMGARHSDVMLGEERVRIFSTFDVLRQSNAGK